MQPLQLRTLLIILLLTLGANASVSLKLSSQFLARGEQALLEIRCEGREPDTRPSIPEIPGVSIEYIGPGQPRMMPGRRIAYTLQYILSSYQIGDYEIPPIEVRINQIPYRTEPTSFNVFDISELSLDTAPADPSTGSEAFNYAAAFRLPKEILYEGETIEAELKIYVPQSLARTVEEWGIPEFERDGLGVWRFEPADTRGQLNIAGQPYISLAYPTTLTASRSGTVTIGPATVRLTYLRTVFDGFRRNTYVQSMLQVPKLDFQSIPLPPGAPAGFDNAVGDFSITARTEAEEIKEGEPISLEVSITGRGNLNNLRSPKMEDESGWKIYESTPNQRGTERTSLSGTVTFSQFIRPLEMKSGIPPFKLVYFDPADSTYKTITTEPIPITMIPGPGGNLQSSGPPQALPLPIERMTDILGLIEITDPLTKSSANPPPWLFHLIAVLIALSLISRALWIKYGHLLEKDPVLQRKRLDYRAVSQQASGDSITFLKSAGGFIERWLGKEPPTEIHDILAQRDDLCFRSQKDEIPLPRKRREEILQRIRKAAFTIILFAFTLTTTSATTPQQAYDSAKFEDAARLWLNSGPYEKLSADTLYNIGNAAYRMGATGHAALYYRRALARESTHPEALQNLRFIERKHGAITVTRPTYQYALAKLSLATWQTAVYAGGWLILIGLLIFPATRHGAKWRAGAVAAFILGPILISLGALGWYYYPDDAKFAPLAKQAVVVADKTALHTDAARTSPQVIDAPPGSLAEVIQLSGRWAYVAFASKTRGWIPVEAIEMVIPKEKPEPPQIRKATIDANSA